MALLPRRVAVSKRDADVFGALSLATFAAAYAIHVATFFSVWCFFAAILGFIIYGYFRQALSLGAVTSNLRAPGASCVPYRLHRTACPSVRDASIDAFKDMMMNSFSKRAAQSALLAAVALAQALVYRGAASAITTNRL